MSFGDPAIETSKRELILARLEALGYRDWARKFRRCTESFRQGYTLPRSCRLWLCPRCRLSRQRGWMDRHKPLLKAYEREGGSAVSFTFTLPHDTGNLLKRLDALLAFFDSLPRMRAWRGGVNRPGWSSEAALFVGIELEDGDDHQGHPHAHGLLLAPSSEKALAAGHWLHQTWLAHHPESSLSAQAAPSLLLPNLGVWSQVLSYLAKGSAFDPLWPNDLAMKMILATPCGARHLRTLGRGRHRKQIKASGIDQAA